MSTLTYSIIAIALIAIAIKLRSNYKELQKRVFLIEKTNLYFIEDASTINRLESFDFLLNRNKKELLFISSYFKEVTGSNFINFAKIHFKYYQSQKIIDLFN